MFDTRQLRMALMRDLDELRSGTILSKEARARAALARTIIESVKVEISVATLNIKALKPVSLDGETVSVVKQNAQHIAA